MCIIYIVSQVIILPIHNDNLLDTTILQSKIKGPDFQNGFRQGEKIRETKDVLSWIFVFPQRCVAAATTLLRTLQYVSKGMGFPLPAPLMYVTACLFP